MNKMNRFYSSSPKLGEVPAGGRGLSATAITDPSGLKATSPNLGEELKSTGTFKWMAILMTALTFTACTEDDLMQPTYVDAGTLHIASVTIDGQQTARTRAVADGGNNYTMSNLPYNQSINAFTAGDKLMLAYRFDDETENIAYATLEANGAWTLTKAEYNDTKDNLIDLGTSLTIAPDKTKGEKWADLVMQATFGDPMTLYKTDEAFATVADNLGIVTGDGIDVACLKRDFLAAASTAEEEDLGFGPITIDTDVKSPTLGAVTIRLKHTDDALLRLPLSEVSVMPGTYIKDGKAYNVTSLATLWAEVREGVFNGNLVGNFPLTKVTIDGVDYLQAIVTAYQSGNQTLTGFKAVMNVTDPSGASATSPNSGEESGSTVTLDLPLTVGTGNSSPESGEVPQAEGYVTLQPNTRYPLTLTIAPHTASVTLTDALGKPGWGTEDEEELSNEMNDNPYILGSATDVDEVKRILEACIAAGKTTITVKGTELATYDTGSDTGTKTVLGEAIRQLTSDENGNINRNSELAGVLTLLLPEVEEIGDYAFRDCVALDNVSAPLATSVGNYAFSGCTKLTSVELPKVTSVGGQAFMECLFLATLTFGTEIESVGKGAFLVGSQVGGCDLTLHRNQLLSAIGPIGNEWMDCMWKSICFVDDEGNTADLSSLVESIEVDGVTYADIDGTATNLSITVKQALSIALFAGYRELRVMGATLEESEDAPNTTTVLGKIIRNYEVDDVSISLLLPEVTSIGDRAFYYCTTLTSVSLPAAISVGGYAFSGCTKLTNVSLSVATEIGYDAFYNCTGLTSVELPVATSIGSSAFSGCTGLTSVSFPVATSIGNSAFSGCTGLTSVELPVATSIGSSAFSGCTGLTSVSLPKVTSVGGSAFYSCTSLTSVSFPVATSIGSSAFSGCTSLTSVELLAATSIGYYAFAYCSALERVSLPAATSIGDYAFRNCTSLTSLTFKSVIKTVGNLPFGSSISSCTTNCDLTLAEGQKNAELYKATEGSTTWANYTWKSISYVGDEGNAVSGS